MTTESATISTPSTLLEELVERTKLSWPQVAIAVGLVLIVLLGVAVHLDGIRARPFRPYSGSDWWHEVRERVDTPAQIVYVLLIYHFVQRSYYGAIEAFRGLMGMGDDDFDQLVAETSPLSRRGEWLAVGIGAAAGLLIYRPWNLPDHFFWMKLYTLLAVTLMFGLLGWVSYVSLADSRQFTELHRQPLDVNVFDPTPFEPIARLSLGISLAFIGGVTLRVLFNPDPRKFFSIESLMTYGASILVAVLVFFLNMMGTHRVIAEAKERELKMVRDNLAAASKALRDLTVKGQVADLGPLPDFVDTWLAYESRVKEVSEWPGTTDIRQNLVLSSLLPSAIGIAKGLLPQLLQRLPPEVLQQLQRFLPLP